MANPNVLVAAPMVPGFSTGYSFFASPGKALRPGPIGTQSPFPVIPVGVPMVVGSGATFPRLDRVNKAAPYSAMTQPGPGPSWASRW